MVRLQNPLATQLSYLTLLTHPPLHLTAVVCVVLEFLVYQKTVSTETLVCLFVVILFVLLFLFLRSLAGGAPDGDAGGALAPRGRATAAAAFLVSSEPRALIL